nr:hypothetical protein [Burkholderia ambifaria]
MKVITLELHALLVVEQHPAHMTTTARQAVNGMPVRPHGPSTIAELVVFVMPHVATSFIERIVGVMLTPRSPTGSKNKLHAAVATATTSAPTTE